MGRGRAKAKQTKVARDLKYNSAPSTDLSRLQQELAGSPSSSERFNAIDGTVDTSMDGSTDEDEGYDDRWVASDR